VQWHGDRAIRQQMREPRDVRHVTGDEDVAAGFRSRELITHPLGRIVRLEPSNRLELRKRRARAQKRFAGLARPHLPAVPDCGRRELLIRREGRELGSLIPSESRQRPLRIDVGSDSIRVVNEKHSHLWRLMIV
jgi:hypothetical protein